MFLAIKYFFRGCVLALIVFPSCENNAPAVMPDRHISPVTNTIQDKRASSALDKSPLDIAYFPADYPVLRMSHKITGPPVARVIYSRPSKDGRKIFGDLVKYDAYWRLGANEATELELFRDIHIQGQTVKKGRYIIYCIPHQNGWTLKLNNDLYTWGLRVHASGDLYSFDVPVTNDNNIYEIFTMGFVGSEDKGELIMAWDNVKVALPFTY